MILQIGEAILGLCVDELYGGADIVIKSLADNFASIRGLSGASVMANGTVCLMLDTNATHQPGDTAVAFDRNLRNPTRERRYRIPLSERQLEQLHTVVDQGADRASSALTTWIGRPSLIRVESLDQLPLNEATAVLGESDDPVCFCAMAVTGWLSGQLILDVR